MWLAQIWNKTNKKSELVSAAGSIWNSLITGQWSHGIAAAASAAYLLVSTTAACTVLPFSTMSFTFRPVRRRWWWLMVAVTFAGPFTVLAFAAVWTTTTLFTITRTTATLTTTPATDSPFGIIDGCWKYNEQCMHNTVIIGLLISPGYNTTTFKNIKIMFTIARQL